MTLGEISSLILAVTQQPGANFTIGGGPSGVNWSSLTNPNLSQGFVEFVINEAYKQLLGDVDDLELALVQFAYSSSKSTYIYGFPPSGYPAVSHIARVFYQPIGQTYIWEFRKGKGLISWEEFQRYTNQGYLSQTAFATIPWVCAVDPTRTCLYFYPGSANAGDVITAMYTPIPTLGAAGCPTLALATDTPITPPDTHMAIYHKAMFYVWTRLRESKLARDSLQDYAVKLAEIRKSYVYRSHGDSIRIEAPVDSLSLDAMGTGVF